MRELIPETLETRVVTRALQDALFKQQLLSGEIAAKAAIEQEISERLPQD